MVNANWDTCFKFVLEYEGGYDTNPKDRGNWTSGKIGVGELKGTKYGIAAFVFPDLDIKNLTVEQASEIYKRDYWPKVAGAAQPSGVDLFMFDTCVNNGSQRALSFQRKVLESDIQAANGLAAKACNEENKVGQIKALAELRGSFYQSLSTFSTFGRGWMRRNAAAEAKATSLALLAETANPAVVNQKLVKESDAAQDSKKKQAAKAAGSGATSAIPSQDAAPWHWDWWTLGKVGLVIILACTAIYFIHRAIVQHERAKAFLKEATGG